MFSAEEFTGTYPQKNALPLLTRWWTIFILLWGNHRLVLFCITKSGVRRCRNTNAKPNRRSFQEWDWSFKTSRWEVVTQMLPKRLLKALKSSLACSTVRPVTYFAIRPHSLEARRSNEHGAPSRRLICVYRLTEHYKNRLSDYPEKRECRQKSIILID